jgi:hypothetical protein
MTAYVTLAEAQTFLDTELGTESWDLSNDVNRTKALEMASKLIDSLPLSTAYQYSDRTDSTVPQDFKDACVLIALKLLDDADLESRFDDTRLISYQYEKIRLVFSETDGAEHQIQGITCARAYRLLKPYCQLSRKVQFHRTS